jgi:hypothetical protein
MRQGVRGAVRTQIERGGLFCDALLDGWRLGEQIERPEQGDRCRRMAGRDHRRDLVGEPPPRHVAAGLGVGCHQIEQIASGSGGALRLARVDDLADQAEPSPAKTPARDIARRRDPGREQDLEWRGLREALAVILQQRAHARCKRLHVEREHRTPGDFDREALHMLGEIDLARLGGERLCQLVGNPGDMPRHQWHGARRERRRDGAALHAPLLALRQQQAASDDRIKEPQRRRGAGVILRVVDQHMTDRGGAVEGQLHAAEQPTFQHLLGEGALGKGGQNVLPRERSVFARRQRFAPGRRRRKPRQGEVA